MQGELRGRWNIFQGMELGEDFIQNMHYSLSQ